MAKNLLPPASTTPLPSRPGKLFRRFFQGLFRLPESHIQAAHTNHRLFRHQLGRFRHFCRNGKNRTFLRFHDSLVCVIDAIAESRCKYGVSILPSAFESVSQSRQKNLRKYNAGISARLSAHRGSAPGQWPSYPSDLPPPLLLPPEIIVSDIFVPVSPSGTGNTLSASSASLFFKGSGSPYNHVFKLLPIQQFDQFEFPLRFGSPCTIISTLCTLRPVSFFNRIFYFVDNVFRNR